MSHEVIDITRENKSIQQVFSIISSDPNNLVTASFPSFYEAEKYLNQIHETLGEIGSDFAHSYHIEQSYFSPVNMRLVKVYACQVARFRHSLSMYSSFMTEVALHVVECSDEAADNLLVLAARNPGEVFHSENVLPGQSETTDIFGTSRESVVAQAQEILSLYNK